jgi:hypothetical protein
LDEALDGGLALVAGEVFTVVDEESFFVGGSVGCGAVVEETVVGFQTGEVEGDGAAEPDGLAEH